MLENFVNPDARGKLTHYFITGGEPRRGERPWRVYHDDSPDMRDAAHLMAEAGVCMGSGWRAGRDADGYRTVVGVRTGRTILIEGASPEDVRSDLIQLNIEETVAWRAGKGAQY